MYRISIGLLACAVLAMAHPNSTVVGTVSSSQSFAVDGYSFPVRGISSWPLVAGDHITTAQAPAVITLQNGIRIRVEPNSCVRIARAFEQVKVELVSGKISKGDKDDDDKPARHRKPHPNSHYRCGDGDDRDDRRCCEDR